MQMKQQEIQMKEEDSIRKADTAITVAQIQAASQGQDQEGSEEAGPDMATLQMNTEKLNLEREKFIKELSLKTDQQREEVRRNKVAEAQKNEEIVIKRKVASRPIPKSKSK